MGPRAPSQYPKRRLFVRSRKVSKPRDWYFKLYRFEIWQAHRQHCCRSACQISGRSDNSKYKSRGFETLRDLTERRLFGYWDRAQDICFCRQGHASSIWTEVWHAKSHSSQTMNDLIPENEPFKQFRELSAYQHNRPTYYRYNSLLFWDMKL